MPGSPFTEVVAPFIDGSYQIDNEPLDIDLKYRLVELVDFTWTHSDTPGELIAIFG